jgi:uncharacterized protein YbjT (DUF2867 family)
VPFNFERPAALVESLRGATTVFNTYWIRFERGDMTFARAVHNIQTLIEAARQAGVRRFVQISITNAAATSPLPYFRGKGVIENTLRESGLSHAIVRPTVIFGPEDILINNIAWSLRKLPGFRDTRHWRIPASTGLCQRLGGTGSECGTKEHEHRIGRGRTGGFHLQ